MTEWLALSDDQRRTSLEQAQINSGILPKAIEKDWWVTLVLKALFELPHARHFIFKGGTSLSKGWHLLRRLSEDIDIALSPEAFGMAYTPAPSHSYVKRIKRAGCAFTSDVITHELQEKLHSYNLYGKTVQVKATPIDPALPDKDPQEIIVTYSSLYPPDPYLEDKVKVEFGTRSIQEPFEEVSLRSILSEYFQQLPYRELPFNVPAASPYKTFIEKMCLMHEKIAIKAIQNPDVERQSRHLYDLVEMGDKDILEKVLADKELYHTIIEHRRHWIRMKGIEYDTLRPESICFVPTEELLEHFRQDYAKMQEGMIYGKRHDFDAIIQKVKAINARINEM